MDIDVFTGSLAGQRLTAAAIFAAAVAAALVYLLAVKIIQSRWRSRDPHTLAGVVIGSQSTFGAVFIIYAGLFAAAWVWPGLDDWREPIIRAGTIGFVALGAWGANKFAGAFLDWYLTAVASRTSSEFDDIIVRFLARFLKVIVVGVAALITLDALGVSINPLLGGLGISGLAVALALQPTLSNIFAGAYVLSEGMIEEGDYIELQGGPAGYVVNVGWRSTKIRTWLNNYVIIPNSVMSNTIVTNYSGPDPKMNILVTCGVSYESDLDRVNDLALEAARETVAANDAAVKGEEPWFGFDRFGDSNIEFWVFLQATDRIGSFIVMNDLIKRLHARFREAGIEINYPVRKLVYEGGIPPEIAARQAAP